MFRVSLRVAPLGELSQRRLPSPLRSAGVATNARTEPLKLHACLREGKKERGRREGEDEESEKEVGTDTNLFTIILTIHVYTEEWNWNEISLLTKQTNKKPFTTIKLSQTTKSQISKYFDLCPEVKTASQCINTETMNFGFESTQNFKLFIPVSNYTSIFGIKVQTKTVKMRPFYS